MGIEIERKFLVISDEWRENAVGVTYRQGFLSTDKERVVRVRVAGDEGFITIKGSPSNSADPLARAEYEYGIPRQDAEAMLDDLCLPGRIEKTRYKIPYQGFVWEVDEFEGDNKGLIVAEVELNDSATNVPLPPWVGEEVSQDYRYANSELSKNPFRKWGVKL